MSMTSEKSGKIHQGRNVRRFRELLGLKQEALSIALGEDWNQKRISLLEAKETLEPEILTQVAKALNVPEEAIKYFDEQAAVNIITNTFTDFKDGASATGMTYNHQCTFNALDKLMEAMEANKNLYERLLQAEREKIELLEKLLKDK